MLWITWRQHRAALVGTAAVTVVIGALLLWMDRDVRELTDACAQHDCITGVAGALGEQLRYLRALLVVGQPVLAGLIAVFWGAPLLAREYEQRTNLLVWSQDVSVLSWLGRKVALLGAAAVVLSVGLAAASWRLVEAMKAAQGLEMDDYGALELWPPTQVTYTLFGFALGLAVGLVARRTVLAMGTALVVFAAVRLVVAYTVLWWLPPLRLRVTGLDHQAPLPAGAYFLNGDSPGDDLIYQPIERLATFRWLEVTTYALLTLALAGVAWTLVRRETRVG
jgi:hypothetical protein